VAVSFIGGGKTFDYIFWPVSPLGQINFISPDIDVTVRTKM
jgi:hypothetical protein